MDCTAETLAGFWDDAWDDCQAEASGFFNQLRSNERAARRLSTAGSLSSVSKNSASQSYRGPGVGSYTNVQIADFWRKLINLYRLLQSEIALEVSSADSQAPTGDPETAIYDRGAILLGNPVTEYSSDFSELLLPATVSPPVPFTQ